MQVTIIERGTHVLRKVAVSGGGRCNCTNSFEDVLPDLKSVYPRGHRLMRRLMHHFSQRDAYQWFEQHGVALTTQADHCVFPQSQDAGTIIHCFQHHCRLLGVDIRTEVAVDSLNQLADYDYVCVCTGGHPRAEGFRWLADMGHTIVSPVPSLFTFSIDDAKLRQLMGTVAEEASVMIPRAGFRACGPLLLTHWGMSGPAILRLSSYAARHLSECDYHSAVSVNWTSRNEQEMGRQLQQLIDRHPQRLLASSHIEGVSSRLWSHLLDRSLPEKTSVRWADLRQKDINRLVNTLCNDTYPIDGRAPFKDEFVTCGGVALSSVDPSTLESRFVPRLFFAGEVLDIDGVTGGFNFQAAWTTAHAVARAIADDNKS